MKIGRSNYNFQFNADTNSVNQLVQSYLQSNQFQMVTENNETFFKSGNAMTGYKGFSYSISNQNINISAWIIGIFGKNYLIDASNMNKIIVMDYANSLNTLLQEISKLENNNVNNERKIVGYNPNTGEPIYEENKKIVGYNPNTGEPIYESIQNDSNVQQNYNNNNINEVSQTFKNETTKKQETMCEIGFWFSVFGLLISFFGISYGVIVYIMDYYFASQGLKTRKRGKAIATIVLSTISIVITILYLLLS